MFCVQEELSKCLERKETFCLYATFVTDMIRQPMLPETIVLPARVSAPGHSVVLIDVCNACGVKIHDHNRSSHVVLLPCSHAYHAFCYAHLAEKGKCLVKDCPGVISAEDQSLLKKKPLEPCPVTGEKIVSTGKKHTIVLIRWLILSSLMFVQSQAASELLPVKTQGTMQ